jgi:YidC/Oxa1 family membrane protein insertase
MLIQLPIIIFLYKVIRNPLSYICRISDECIIKLNSLVNGLAEDAAFKSIDQINLISKMSSTDTYDAFFKSLEPARDIPNFNLFGQHLADTPSITALSMLCLIPIVAAGLQWLSMFLMRKWNANPNQLAAQDAQTNMSMKMMDFVMPLMTLFITFSFSAMMGLYWIYQSIIAIIQTFIISRAMPIPKFSEEEIKELRKAQKAAEKAQKAILKEQPKYRSLHYIDEDDYEELPTVKTQKPQSKNNSDRPEIKD